MEQSTPISTKKKNSPGFKFKTNNKKKAHERQVFGRIVLVNSNAKITCHWFVFFVFLFSSFLPKSENNHQPNKQIQKQFDQHTSVCVIATMRSPETCLKNKQLVPQHMCPLEITIKMKIKK